MNFITNRWVLPYLIPELDTVGLYLHDIVYAKQTKYNKKWYSDVETMLISDRFKALKGAKFTRCIYNGQHDFALNLPTVDFFLRNSSDENLKEFHARIHEVLPDLVRKYGNKVESFVTESDITTPPVIEVPQQAQKEVPVNQSLSLKEVNTLSQLSATYEYEDKVVVPSQSYAKFCGKDVKVVNQAVQRVAESGRLKDGEHFFKLDNEEARSWVRVTNCDSELSQSLAANRGLTLLTKLAVNTLSHHFNDTNSVNLSNSINDTATRVQEVGSGDSLLQLQSFLQGLMQVNQEQISERNARLSLQAEVKDTRADVELLKQKASEPVKIDIQSIKKGDFPKGCMTLDQVRYNFFKGVSPQIVKQYMRHKNHPSIKWNRTSHGTISEKGAVIRFDMLDAWKIDGLKLLSETFFKVDIERSKLNEGARGPHYNCPVLGVGFYLKPTKDDEENDRIRNLKMGA